ncbi:hypothetical protein GUJ93_ZPchr0013g33837 [Zizania palustris]|uniref:Tubby C-terminal domain-containing protein n=1 Tax=Zizania palustris TaxID=103762 RepID=A0A8J5X651_ZIZPA|nr:hypothetical protein GUJ93_ZPchr0013g33837 [Zizania palustris]
MAASALLRLLFPTASGHKDPATARPSSTSLQVSDSWSSLAVVPGACWPPLLTGVDSALTDKGKFLLAARSFRNRAHTEYIISYECDDLFLGSNSYVGKLR